MVDRYGEETSGSRRTETVAQQGRPSGLSRPGRVDGGRPPTGGSSRPPEDKGTVSRGVGAPAGRAIGVSRC